MLEDAIRDRLIVHNKRIIYNSGIIEGDGKGRIVLRDEYRPETLTFDLDKLIAILEIPIDPNYEEVRQKYQKGLDELYEEVRSGKIKDWRALNTRGTYFLAWEVNIRGVVRQVTEKYLLKDYNCSLEDLPLQLGIVRNLRKHKIWMDKKFRKVKRGVRDIFLIAYPEMKDNPAWRAERWKKEPARTISSFRRDYLFRYKLRCKTREQVVNVLNDELRMQKALRQEKLLGKIWAEKHRTNYFSFYSLIEGLRGEMYRIDPWELNTQLPKNTFKNPDKSINKKRVGDYLLWIDKNYLIEDRGFANRSLRDVPHYRTLAQIGLSASELESIYHQARRRAPISSSRSNRD